MVFGRHSSLWPKLTTFLKSQKTIWDLCPSQFVVTKGHNIWKKITTVRKFWQAYYLYIYKIDEGIYLNIVKMIFCIVNLEILYVNNFKMIFIIKTGLVDYVMTFFCKMVYYILNKINWMIALDVFFIYNLCLLDINII